MNAIYLEPAGGAANFQLSFVTACEHSRARDYAQTGLACFALPDGGPCLPNKSTLYVGKLDFFQCIGKLYPAAASPWAHFKRVSFRRGKPGTAAEKLKVLLAKKS